MGGGGVKVVWNSFWSYFFFAVCVRERSPLSTYFYFDPFKSSCGCYNIRPELAYKFPVINWFPSTFGSILGRHMGCVF